MQVLGIETSCDETAAAVYDGDRGLLGHSLFSQAKKHAEYGGVVPELASRDHIRKLLPMITRALAQAGSSVDDIHGIAYTAGPGLAGALLVGSSLSQALSMAWGKPALGIHHMEGHLLAPMLEDPAPAFPFIALLVSGGHTLLVEVTGLGRYRILGESIDDAVGEAFDKTAKLLGLPYPGGPALAALAERGDPNRFRLPRPMTTRAGFDFSFSGLKTAVLVEHRKLAPQDAAAKADLARAFEEAAVDTLAIKCQRALEATGRNQLVVAGGVGANKRLRERLRAMMTTRGGTAYFPRLEFCTDNGAMIAYAGWARMSAGEHGGVEGGIRTRWPLDELAAPA